MQRSDVACVTQSGFKRLCLSPLLTLPSQRGPSLQVFLLWAPPSHPLRSISISWGERNRTSLRLSRKISRAEQPVWVWLCLYNTNLLGKLGKDTRIPGCHWHLLLDAPWRVEIEASRWEDTHGI